MIVAYFAPSLSMLRRLFAIARSAAGRGSSRRRSSTINATVGAARFFYWRLLKRGAEIYEYQATKLHSKLILIDDVVHIGSANFDLRSLYLNLEMMLRIDDPAFAAMMRRFVEGEIANSRRITLEAHRAEHDLVEPAEMGFRLFPDRHRRLQSVAPAQFRAEAVRDRAARPCCHGG